MDFNLFSEELDEALKTLNLSLSAAQKKNLMQAVSVYDAQAEKVVKKKEKLQGDKLSKLLDHLGCKEEELPYFGYYPTGKKGEYIVYESETDLRDAEQIGLNENILDYFLREVHPHVPEAWIDLDSVKIGYEISFNKYFYQHTPLRPVEEIARDLLTLEQEAEGLLKEILGC